MSTARRSTAAADSTTTLNSSPCCTSLANVPRGASSTPTSRISGAGARSACGRSRRPNWCDGVELVQAIVWDHHRYVMRRQLARGGFPIFEEAPPHYVARGIRQEVAMLKGKTAVVTGSTSGIGLAIARAMAREGANTVINGFGDKAAIEKERVSIEQEFSVKAIYSPADMTKPAEIADMIRTAEKTFGSVDVLVNNAGIQHVAPIEDFPIDKWDAIIAINL